MSEPTPDGCPHANCGCAPASPHTPFCGAYCANADAGGEGPAACACGHEACRRSQETGRSGSEPKTSVGPP